jgi:hypothetical protein
MILKGGYIGSHDVIEEALIWVIYETFLPPSPVNKPQVNTKAVDNGRLFNISTTNVLVSNVGHCMYCKSEERRLESDNVEIILYSVHCHCTVPMSVYCYRIKIFDR